MTDLAEFLLARIAEDEAKARAAGDVAAAPWRWEHLPPPLDYGLVGVHPIQGGATVVIIPSRSGDMWPDRDTAAHIAHWDPARVLAKCAADRRIVELHQSWPVLVEQAPEMDLGHADTVSATVMRVTQRIAWLTQQEYRQRFGDEPPTTPILRALALPYADHPDYRPEWRP